MVVMSFTREQFNSYTSVEQQLITGNNSQTFNSILSTMQLRSE